MDKELKQFVTNAPIEVAMFDHDMRYLAASPIWVSTYAMPGEFEGRSHYEIFPDIPDRWKEAHRRGLAGETLSEKGDEFLLPSGKRLLVDWTITPWMHVNDNRIGGISIFSSARSPGEIERDRNKSTIEIHDFFMSLPVAYQSLDILGNWLDSNQRMADLLGFDDPAQMRGRNFTEFWSAETLAENPFEHFKKTGNLNGEQTLIRRDGARISVLIVGRIERNAAGDFLRTHCALFDISERKKIEEEIVRLNAELERKVEMRTKELEDANFALKELARHDPLTGLPNRLAANERLETEFALLRRSRLAYSILMIDVDHFKHINDSFGHAAGDMVLQEIGKIFTANLRASDFICRFGGEEFMALLPHTAEPEARTMAEKLRVAIEDATVLGVTISAGVATARPDDADCDVAVLEADARLYQAKNAGRNRTI
jgi:diguanylate cyclase (GGDEF)-like protein/PAS domain S-box-containing protein